MFSPRKILYISNYDFGEGHDERNKYLIVLHNTGNHAILVGLTTSKCHVPEALMADENRCKRDFDNNIHTYHIPEKQELCSTTKFSFDIPTFIDINKSQVFERPIAHLSSKYADAGLIQEKAHLNEDEYINLLYCISKARHINRGIKADIEKLVATYYQGK